MLQTAPLVLAGLSPASPHTHLEAVTRRLVGAADATVETVFVSLS